MTLSAVDNPFDLIGADRTGADAAKRKRPFGSDDILFKELLAEASVHQVAYAGTSEEFGETLRLRDDTFTANQTGDDRTKYEGIGLFENREGSVQHSSRAPKKLDDPADESADGTPADAQALRVALQGPHKQADDGQAGSGDEAESGVLAGPVAQSAVASDPSGRTAASQNNTGGNGARTDVPNGQNVASLATSGGKHNAVDDELGRSRIAAYVSRQAGNPSGNGPIKVTEVPADVVSQPTSTLAAGASLAAQTDRSGRAPSEPRVTLAEDLDGEGRVSLLDGNNSRANGKTQSNAVQPQPKPQTANNGPEGQPANAGQQPNTGLLNPQTLVAAAAARGDAPVQPTTTIGDPLAGGPTTNNAGQAAQRTHQPQAPQPPKPPVRPEQLTGQVAIQIKKAIGQGSDHLRIQLKPAELGRVEIKLEVNDKGHAVAVVTADRADTLDLLQRDAQGLRQALQEAGLSTDSNSLSFNLRGEGGKFGQEMAERGHTVKGGDADTGSDTPSDAAEAAVVTNQNVISDGHVNVQI